MGGYFMEYFILFILMIMFMIIVYKTPFATDNPMGYEIGKCVLFIVNEINIKNRYIRGAFAIDRYIKRHIDNKVLEFIDNYYISLNKNTAGLKKKINNSDNIIWIHKSNNRYMLYNMNGELIH
jgi:hypothetical protein